MVSPTPHQSNPHVACRTYGDRRSPRTRAATVSDDPEPDGVASNSESSDTLQPDSRDRRIVTGRHVDATHIHRSPKPLKTSQIQA